MTLLRGCPTRSMEVSFISGISRPTWPGSERPLPSTVLPGPSPSCSGEARVVSGEPRPGPGLLPTVLPLPCRAHVCWVETGWSGLASSSDLGFFFLPVFFFLVTLDGSDWKRFKAEQPVLRAARWAGSLQVSLSKELRASELQESRGALGMGPRARGRQQLRGRGRASTRKAQGNP